MADKVVYERNPEGMKAPNPPKQRRYVVQWRFHHESEWRAEKGPGYRFLWLAKFGVLSWNASELPARVIDRRNKS